MMEAIFGIKKQSKVSTGKKRHYMRCPTTDLFSLLSSTFFNIRMQLKYLQGGCWNILVRSERGGCEFSLLGGFSHGRFSFSFLHEFFWDTVYIGCDVSDRIFRLIRGKFQDDRIENGGTILDMIG